MLRVFSRFRASGVKSQGTGAPVRFRQSRSGPPLQSDAHEPCAPAPPGGAGQGRLATTLYPGYSAPWEATFVMGDILSFTRLSRPGHWRALVVLAAIAVLSWAWTAGAAGKAGEPPVFTDAGGLFRFPVPAHWENVTMPAGSVLRVNLKRQVPADESPPPAISVVAQYAKGRELGAWVILNRYTIGQMFSPIVHIEKRYQTIGPNLWYIFHFRRKIGRGSMVYRQYYTVVNGWCFSFSYGANSGIFDEYVAEFDELIRRVEFLDTSPP